MGLKQFDDALEVLERCHTLASQTKRFLVLPTKEWLEECKRLKTGGSAKQKGADGGSK
jgi:hypothetical protein